MKQVSQHYRTGELAVRDLPPPALRSGGVIVATRASLLSAGTEKAVTDLAKASLAGKALARPDLVRQVRDKVRREGLFATLDKVRTKLDTPVALGYSCAGTVAEVGAGVDGLKTGDRVACGGAGYATHAQFNFIPKNLCVPIPDSVDDEDASFVTVGAIALQGLRQAQPTLGERVVVIGLGLLGLLTVQLLKANGCRVLGYDPVQAKCDLARTLGADAVATTALIEAADSFTEGRGADAVIVTASTKSDEPANTAAAIARLKGRIVLVGMVGMNLARDAFYRKELDLRLSMSYGPGRYDPAYEEHGQDYPFAYVRWTEQRNMSAFLHLVGEGRVTPKALITHRFSIADAERAYALLSGDEPYIGIVLTYDEAPLAAGPRRIELPSAATGKRPGPTLGQVAFIGAGNFARSVLLPRLHKRLDCRFTGVATATGLSAASVAEKFAFRYATTAHREVLDDPETDTVFIATRHDSHARLAVEALRAGKNVFVEKPLAVSRDQLAQVVEAATKAPGLLMVGFNRRFSPMVLRAGEVLAGRTAPLVMHYRVNAGMLPPESWLVGEEGGGRIIGEVCHFIDTMQALTDASPVAVHGIAAADHPDAVAIQVSFADGSIGTVTYSALGDPAFPKEYVEVFSAGRVIIIDDFRSAVFIADGKRSRMRLRRQDKGFDEELARFLTAVRSGGDAPIPLASLIATTEATFAAVESIAGRRPVFVGAAKTDPTP